MSGHKSLLLALDQGSQSTRAILFDRRGRCLHKACAPVSVSHLDAHRIEQSGEEITTSMDVCLSRLFQQSGIETHQVSAAGLASQRSSVIAWNAGTQRPCTHLISWQDTRCADWVDEHAAYASCIRQKTGLPFSPHYGATKIRWLLQHADLADVPPNHLRIGPVASFYVSHLTNIQQPVVDPGNALRTQLVNLDTLDWDPDLLALFGIPRAVLPDIHPIRHDYGALGNEGVPITSVNGDQAAALFSQGCLPLRTAWVTLGTGGFLSHPCERRMDVVGLLSSVINSDAHSRQYAIEGTVNGAGAALLWARQTLHLPEEPATLLHHIETSTRQPGLIFLNSVSGLGSPWWRTENDPHWVNLHGARESAPNKNDALIAVCESILFLIRTNLERMLDAGCDIQTLHLSGGLANLDWMGQGLADVTGLPVLRFPDTESTARGIAYLAAGCPDDWIRVDPVRFVPRPNPDLLQRYELFIEFLNKHINTIT